MAVALRCGEFYRWVEVVAAELRSAWTGEAPVPTRARSHTRASPHEPVPTRVRPHTGLPYAGLE
jgi:hypothetical protein